MFASATPSADPSPPPAGSAGRGARQATEAAGWVEENWSTWVNTSLRIVVILAVALAPCGSWSAGR